MIIGITGTFASGKDTVAEYLAKKKGFERVTLSDIIREELKKRGLSETRENLQKIGNELRRQKGPLYLLKEALSRVKSNKVVIAGVRQRDEADFFKQGEDRILLAVDAPPHIRFERLRARGRKGDTLTWEEFVAKEKEEMSGKGGIAQDVKYCMDKADFVLDNSGDEDYLYDQIDEILEIIQEKEGQKSR